MKLVIICLMLSSFVFGLSQEHATKINKIHRDLDLADQKISEILIQQQRQLDSLKVALKHMKSENAEKRLRLDKEYQEYSDDDY